jgi:hypothetical protein
MSNQTVFDGIVYDIRLHSESDELFRCENCGAVELRQVTDIEQGALGFEVYECRCGAQYRCNTIGEIDMATKKVSDLANDYSDAMTPFEWLLIVIVILLLLGGCLWMLIF